MASGLRILVIDDDPLVRWSVTERLRAGDLEVIQAGSVAEATAALAKSPDLMLLDYTLPDGDGLSILREAHTGDPDLPVIMLTAHHDAETIVAAMKAGAFDYLTKPFEVAEVEVRVRRALEITRGARELRRLRSALARPFSLASIIGESSVMQNVKTLAKKIAASPTSTVLLTGESGTGKDLLAKVIHYGSARAAHPFLNITCSAIPDTLLESELFGYERGAFTDARQMKRGLFEQAALGTLFLDEIGETTPGLQAKLLRVLEERAFRRVGGTVDLKVDVRVIAATNRDLEHSVREGRFREDLYYRLNVLRLEMPPLRQREGDVALLAQFFLETFAKEFRRPIRGYSAEAERRLLAYGWPGNVRELRNLVERAVLLTDHDVLEPSDFEFKRRVLPATDSGATRLPIELPVEGINLDDVEKSLVLQALERANGNRTRAGALLGLHRDQVRYRIEKFGLPAER